MAERLATLEKAFRRRPELPLFARLADQYLQRGMASRAAELCRTGLLRFPDYPAGHIVYSRCHQAVNDLEAARDSLAEALRLDPENPAGLRQLASLLERLGEAEEARQVLLGAARLDPLDEEVRRRLDEFAYSERLESVCPRLAPLDELPREPEGRRASAVPPPVATPPDPAAVGEAADRAEPAQAIRPPDERIVRALGEIEAAGQEPAGGPAVPAPNAPAELAVPEVAVPPIATATLAEIYHRQGLTEHAMQVYELLVSKEPHNERWQVRLAQLRAQAAAESLPPPQETR